MVKPALPKFEVHVYYILFGKSIDNAKHGLTWRVNVFSHVPTASFKNKEYTRVYTTNVVPTLTQNQAYFLTSLHDLGSAV